MVKKPFKRFAPRQMLRYLMLLPLNFVPVVGTVIFVALQGKRAGPGWHDRYFQLKRMGVGKRDGFVEKNRGAYTRYVSLPHYLTDDGFVICSRRV